MNGAPVFSKQITVTLNGEGKGVLAVSDYQSVKGVKEATTKLVKKMQYKNQWRMLEKQVNKTYGLLQRKNLDILLKRNCSSSI